jgi:hypothetical protein
MSGYDNDLDPYAPEFRWRSDVEWQIQWLEEEIDRKLQPYLDEKGLAVKPEPDSDRITVFMKNAFRNIPVLPDYAKHVRNYNNSSVFIDGVERGVWNDNKKDYGYYDSETGKTNIGRNFHGLMCTCGVKEDKNVTPLKNYNVVVDGSTDENMKVYKMDFDVCIVKVENKCFYVTPSYRISGRPNPEVTIDESKKAFYHEKGHHEIVNYCFDKIKPVNFNKVEPLQKTGTPSFVIPVKMPFSGDDDDAFETAWAWCNDRQNIDTLINIIKKKTNERLDKINGDGEDSYYHKKYGPAGNYWEGYKAE